MNRVIALQLDDSQVRSYSTTSFRQPGVRPFRTASVAARLLPNYVLFLGPHTTEPETIRQEMQLAGYRLVSSHGFLEYQSFRVFSAMKSMETDTHPEPKEK